MRISFLLTLFLSASCGDDTLPTCAELECVAIACGTLTPEGVTNPDVCTCQLPMDGFATCRAD